MSEVAVTYNGPAGAYHAPDEDGTWHEFVRGATATVSETFADSLLDLDDHTFELDFEPPGFDEAKDDPDGSTPVVPNFGGS